MKIFEYAERINLLDKLIREKRTGNLYALSKRMNLSKSRMCHMIEELKTMGAPIEYSRRISSYYYVTGFQMSIQLNFCPLPDNSLIEVDANELHHIPYSFFAFLFDHQETFCT